MAAEARRDGYNSGLEAAAIKCEEVWDDEEGKYLAIALAKQIRNLKIKEVRG